jgi:hypothetical protein
VRAARPGHKNGSARSCKTIVAWKRSLPQSRRELFLLRFYPVLGAKAISQKHELKAADAFRVWTVARSLDPAGAGIVSVAALRARLFRLGRAKSTISKMISQAIARGWISKPDWKPGHLRMRSPGRVARSMGCYDVGGAVEMDERLLFTPGWKANVWAGVESLFDGQQISVKKLYEKTGISPRSQARYRRQARVRTKPNYAISKLSADHVPGLKAAGRAALPMGEFAGWRIPDTRYSPVFIRSCPKGRSRKNNQEARRTLSIEGQDTRRVTRLFYDGLKAASRSKADEVYYLIRSRKAYNLHGVLA